MKKIGHYNLVSESPDLVLVSSYRVTVERLYVAAVLIVLLLPTAMAMLSPFAGSMTLIITAVFLLVLALIRASRQALPTLLMDPVRRVELRAAAEGGYRTMAPWHLIVDGRRFESREIRELTIREFLNPQDGNLFHLHLVLDSAVVRLDTATTPEELTPLVRLLQGWLRQQDEDVPILPQLPSWSATFRMVGLVLLETVFIVLIGIGALTFFRDALTPIVLYPICSAAVVIIDWALTRIMALALRRPIRRFLAENFGLRA